MWQNLPTNDGRMALTHGTRIGPFEVTGALGVGGMGEVYRARDSKLQREVAIKVLPPAFAHDAERLARFEREARTLASLNHPNIAHVYGLEDANGSKALVMELVDGPTLADRVAAGALPRAEALRMARQITDALEAAHEQGIVHRDLKPANIKVTPDGVVKVLDFGLAKIADPTGSSMMDRSQLPTITTPAMTQAGVILGTAAYMSPEQAKGRPTDKRTDVWAFGCVLFEMLTGQRAFAGEDVADTLAFVLTKEPDWTALPADTPDYLRSLLRRCLEKDRKARVPDIAVARFQIDEASSAVSATVRPSSSVARRERLAWAAGLLLCAAVGVGLVFRERSVPPAPAPVVRFSIAPPPGGFFPGANGTPRMAVSPDGRYVAFTVNLRDNTPNQLWVRRLDSLEARQVTEVQASGGEPVQQPFWSPDSRTIGFFADGKLRRVDLEDGAVQALCDVPGNNYGGTWGEDGTILFASNATAGIRRVAAGGGVPAQVTKVDTGAGEVQHLWPRLLPGGRHFLYQAHGREGDARAIYVGSLDEDARVRVLESPVMVEFAEPGFLLVVRDGVLMAHRFDLESFRLTGEPTVLAENVQVSPGNGRAGVSASSTGVLVYTQGAGQTGADSQLVWVDRSGRELSTVGRPANIRGFELSPDGRRIALHVEDLPGRGDIWVHDLGRGTTSRLTFDPEQHNQNPVWTRDGQTVVFSKRRSLVIYEKDAQGVGAERSVHQSTDAAYLHPLAVGSDGGLVVQGLVGGQTGLDLLALRAGGRELVPLVATSAREVFGELSLDGRWLAYESNESGAPEVYVQSFPTPTTRLQVSAAGGLAPRWRPDGRELFYLSNGAGGPLMAVAVEPGGDGLRLGPPTALFPPLNGPSGHDTPVRTYAVMRDGQRFLVSRVFATPGARTFELPLTVVLNWSAALR